MTYRPNLLPPAASATTIGAVKPNPQTLAVAADGTLSAVLMAVTPRAFGAITDGGTFGDGGSHPASANGFSTLAALQTVYPFATALSNDMAGLMIQAAVNYADAHRFRQVLLDAGKYYNLPSGIIMPIFTLTRLVGAGRAFTIILCSPCGINPGITILGASNNAYGPVQDIGFWGFDSTSLGDPSTRSAGNAPGNSRGGNPDPMLYTAGSVGINMSNCNYVTFRGLGFQNFDRTTVFSATGNNYIIAFDECLFALNNIGWALENYSAVNSYEKMSLRNCTIGNNNTGVLVLFGDGGNVGIAGDVTLYDCSLDYNVEQQIKYVGAQKEINTRQNSVRMVGGHMETNSATSGGGSHYRVFNNGDFRMFDVEVAEQGDLPYCVVVHPDNAAATSVHGCRQPNNPFPWVYVGNSLGYVTGGSNSGGALAYDSTSGHLYTPTRHPGTQTLGADLTLFGDGDNSCGGSAFLIAGSCNITIPADGGGFDYMLNTGFTFRTAPGQTGTFVQGSGCTITSSGTGVTFGGAKPAQVYLTKVGPSAWIATGQMS